jgi:soluble lytic murein transglycosylase
MKRLCQSGLAAFVLVWGASSAGAPGPAARAVSAYRTAPATAGKGLEEAAEAVPTLAEPLRLLAAEAHLAAGDTESARRLATTMTETRRPWRGRVHWILARALPVKACKERLDALEKAPAAPPHVPEAERLAVLEETLRRCRGAGDAQALAARRTLALQWPESEPGQRASSGLSLSWSDRIEQAASHERARDYASARTVLLAVVTEAPDEAVRDEARFQHARLELERIREDFPLAARLFGEVAARGGARAVEAEYSRARALGRGGDVASAVAAYDAFLQRHPTAPQALDARFFRVFLPYEAGGHGASVAGFDALAVEPGPWRDPAAWYAAFARHLAGRADAAAALLDLAEKTRDPATARRARYWAARSLEASAPDRARALDRALVESDPLDWYALLVRLGPNADLVDVAALPVVETPPAVPGAGGAQTKALEEIRLLVRAGLDEFARDALAEVWTPLRAPGRWGLASYYARLTGDWSRLHRAAHLEGKRPLAMAPSAAYVTLWRDAWPRAYPEAVERAIRGRRLARSEVWAFMLKESAYRPAVVSEAHAVGLMQLLPRTAQALVLPGEPPAPSLFDPSTNIELAARYLDLLGARFDGQLPLVAAAYNAGPESVVSWFRGRPRERLDLFVENIPFRETRDYVKRVVEFAVTYRVVHEGESLSTAVRRLSPTLDLTVRPGVRF